MDRWKRCAAWLGLTGACLFAIGCGSDVPDPASDANANNGTPVAGDGGAAAAPAVAAAGAPKGDDAAATEKPAAETPKEQPKEQAKGNAATSEMLALSGGNQPAPGGGGAAPGPQPSAPGPGAAPAAPGPAHPDREHRDQAAAQAPGWVRTPLACRAGAQRAG